MLAVGIDEGLVLTPLAVLGVKVLIEMRPAIRLLWRNMLRPPFGGRQTPYYRFDLSAHIREMDRCPSAVLKHSYTSQSGGMEPAALQGECSVRLREMRSPPAAGILKTTIPAKGQAGKYKV